jgi:hypothetical protein
VITGSPTDAGLTAFFPAVRVNPGKIASQRTVIAKNTKSINACVLRSDFSLTPPEGGFDYLLMPGSLVVMVPSWAILEHSVPCDFDDMMAILDTRCLTLVTRR